LFIYAARNTVNGKLYVGLTTVSVAVRWASHMYDARSGSKLPFHRAIRKYGPKAFVIEQIAALLPGKPYEELAQLEREIIAQENCQVPHGYNVTAGGEGYVGYQAGPEARAKLSEATKAYWADPARAEQRAQRKPRLSAEERAARAAERATYVAGRPARMAAAAEKKRAKMLGRKIGHGERISATKKAIFADPEKGAQVRANMSKGWTPERREAARQLRIEMNKTLNTPEHVAALIERNRSRGQTEVIH
jgi:group I intron endonuclease